MRPARQSLVQAARDILIALASETVPPMIAMLHLLHGYLLRIRREGPPVVRIVNRGVRSRLIVR